MLKEKENPKAINRWYQPQEITFASLADKTLSHNFMQDEINLCKNLQCFGTNNQDMIKVFSFCQRDISFFCRTRPHLEFNFNSIIANCHKQLPKKRAQIFCSTIIYWPNSFGDQKHFLKGFFLLKNYFMAKKIS